MESEKYTEVIRTRITSEEKKNLQLQAELAGLSVSAMIRKKISGIKITAKVEATLINEIRRQGGLLKNNFETIRRANFSEADKKYLLQRQEDLLGNMQQLVQSIMGVQK